MEVVGPLSKFRSTGSSSPEGGWSSQSEQALEDWARHAQSMRDCHLKCATLYTQYHQRLSLPFLVVAALASFGTGGGIFEKSDWLSIFSFVMTLFASVLGSVSNFLDYGRLSEKHHQTANGYSSFARDISTAMLFNRKNRQPLRELVKELRVKYEDVSDRAPLVPESVSKPSTDVHKRVAMSMAAEPEDRFPRESLPFVHVERKPQPLPSRPPPLRLGRRMSDGDLRSPSRQKEKQEREAPFARISRSVQSRVRTNQATLPPLPSFFNGNQDSSPVLAEAVP